VPDTRAERRLQPWFYRKTSGNNRIFNRKASNINACSTKPFTSRGLFFIAQRRAARNRIDMTIRLDRYSPKLRTELTVFKPSGRHFQSRSARMESGKGT